MSAADEPDYSATEITVAGGGTWVHYGLSYDRLCYLRAKHYPRVVSAEPIVDLDDVLGPAYPGAYKLG